MNPKRLFLKSLGGAASAVLLNAAHASGSSTANAQEAHFTNAVVETHDGKKVLFYDDLIKGKVVIFNMMYTVCASACPTNTANLLALQHALGSRVGQDVYIYSITLQPEIDDAATLRAYAAKYGVRPGWKFLTGRRSDIEVIRRRLGFYDTDPVADADLSTHAGVLRIGNARYNRWFMMPVAAPTRQIVRSVLNTI